MVRGLAHVILAPGVALFQHFSILLHIEPVPQLKEVTAGLVAHLPTPKSVVSHKNSFAVHESGVPGLDGLKQVQPLPLSVDELFVNATLEGP
jgi:hypothetical protein